MMDGQTGIAHGRPKRLFRIVALKEEPVKRLGPELKGLSCSILNIHAKFTEFSLILHAGPDGMVL
jgi:hypothetical protein